MDLKFKQKLYHEVYYNFINNKFHRKHHYQGANYISLKSVPISQKEEYTLTCVVNMLINKTSSTNISYLSQEH